MTRRKHLRRVAILCCHCLRNLAFYKGGWRKGKFVVPEEFWVNANGNFLDICVLEWCKLFADRRGKHYWRKIITNETLFYTGLLNELGIKESEFDAFTAEMRTYRDKFIAHLDLEETMYIPKNLIFAEKSASYLYDYLLANEDEGGFFVGGEEKGSIYYEHYLKHGEAIYEKALLNILQGQ